MNRILLVTIVLALPGAAAAQPPVPVKRLTLHPSPSLAGALKYRLLPEQRELSTGNALTVYYRAFSPEWIVPFRDAKFQERVLKALNTPLKDLKINELSFLRTSALLKELDRGARRSYCDWELNERLREQGMGTLIPDVQTLRLFGSFLAARARIEVADSRYDEAARALQTGFALSRHTADGPTIIQGLVGVAVASLMLNQVEAWIGQPGAPNLYWPLTDLPRPFIDLRRGLEGEKITIDQMTDSLRDALARPKLEPMPPSRLETMRAYAGSLAFDVAGRDAEGIVVSTLAAANLYVRGKAFLAGQGRSAAEIDALPVLQVIAHYQVAEYDRHFDDLARWRSLPYPVARLGMHRAIQSLREQGRRDGVGTFTLARMMLPAVEGVFDAQVRIQRRVDALRVVEAIRLHAHANGGQLPVTLDAITEAPIPNDPATGTPFVYRRDGDRATLTGPPLRPGEPFTAIHYELTIGP